MELKIGNKTYELYFGIDFLRQVDKNYGMSVGGDTVNMNFGYGLISLLAQLEAKSPVAIFDTIKAATNTLDQKPSNAAIEDFIAECDFDEVVESFFVAIEQSKIASKVLSTIGAAIGAEEKKETKEETKED